MVAERNPSTSKTLSTKEVAELANVDARTIRYWMNRKGLIGHFEGYQLRFYEKDVLEFLTAKKITTAGRKKNPLPNNIVQIEKAALAFFADTSKPCEVCKKPMPEHEWVHMDEEGIVIHCANVKES